jgi:hypothetical protein
MAIAISANLLGLAACKSGNTNLATAANYVSSIATGFLNVLPKFADIEGMPTALMAQIGQWIADLQNLAAVIKTTAEATAAQPVVQQVEADVNAIVGALAGFPIIPPPISTVLTAATFLLPVIEAAINMLLLPEPPVAPATTAGVRIPAGAVARGRARFKAPVGYTTERALADLHRKG